MKRRGLKAKQDCSFWSSIKCRKILSKINNSVKSYVKKRIISYPHVIKYPIKNDYIAVNIDNGNGGVNN